MGVRADDGVGELLGVDDDGLTLGLDEGVLQIKLADVRRAHEIK